jgi:hypothetical protein
MNLTKSKIFSSRGSDPEISGFNTNKIKSHSELSNKIKVQ